MASLAFPSFLFRSFPPPQLPPRRFRFQCYSLFAPVMRLATPKKGSAILWFKQDLRVDDHPGLVAASEYETVLPLYVFDHRILSCYSDEMLQLLLFALRDLRKSLQEQGSNLMIRYGRAETVIQELVKEVQTTYIYIEEEVEYHLREVINHVEIILNTIPSPYTKPMTYFWRMPFYDIKNLNDLTESFEDFKKLQLPVSLPTPPPILDGPYMDLKWGPLPTLDDVKEFMIEHQGQSTESWLSIRGISALSILMKKSSKLAGTRQSTLNLVSTRSISDGSVFLMQNPDVVKSNTNAVLNILAAYLRYLEGTARYDWQEVHDRLRTAETRDGASFASLFGPALHLGIVSRRKVHYEAIKYEKERNAGFLSPFGYSTTTIAAAIDTVCSMEWYWILAEKSQIHHGTCSIRIWRWKGHLIQYKTVGNEGPAVLLVHGFGAFLEHYRDNINSIAEGGCRVWAITILGFGKSEKPNIVYTELMWAETLKDFLVEVVGEPVHLVGNSIGGYFISIVARLWPDLVKSLVLINSAGNVIPQYSLLQFSEDRQTSGAIWLGARALLFYLKLNIKSIVKSCYPTKAERADDWLVNEMLRASHDPGVLVVLESIFSFNLSLPLNFLLEGIEERVLIIQGMKDPISDSKSKLALLKEHCSGIKIRVLDAGHCPHDECPEEVNSIIQNWVMEVENKTTARILL